MLSIRSCSIRRTFRRNESCLLLILLVLVSLHMFQIMLHSDVDFVRVLPFSSNDTQFPLPKVRMHRIRVVTTLPATEISRKKAATKPTASAVERVWPMENEREDRILAQMTYRSKWFREQVAPRPKVILNWFGGNNEPGKSRYIRDQCLVRNCFQTNDRTLAPIADAITFVQAIGHPNFEKPPHQIWVMYQLESPLNSPNPATFGPRSINWTATYRRDSTIVTPYERWTPFPNFTKPAAPSTNYAKGKTKKVAWFVSNCAANNRRQQYATELGMHIEVDVFGSCGTKHCQRRSESCFRMLKDDYKFYLAFENSNCRDYITEKLYWNAYKNNIVPIVMGAHPDDYFRSTPPHSYIHVDEFDSPRELAAFLVRLDRDDVEYNRYFRWKGQGEFINTKYHCRLCALLNDQHVTHVPDVERWWRGSHVCIRPSASNRWASWRRLQRFSGNRTSGTSTSSANDTQVFGAANT